MEGGKRTDIPQNSILKTLSDKLQIQVRIIPIRVLFFQYPVILI